MAKWASKISTVAFLVAISILLPAQAPTPELIPCCFSSKIPNSLRAPSVMRSRIQFIATL